MKINRAPLVIFLSCIAFAFSMPSSAETVVVRAGRMLADGDLKLITLSLLAEAPRHGYDIIKALEERTSGIYSPSPGVVYPTLTFLEEAGYAASAADGNKKVFSINLKTLLSRQF